MNYRLSASFLMGALAFLLTGCGGTSDVAQPSSGEETPSSYASEKTPAVSGSSQAGVYILQTSESTMHWYAKKIVGGHDGIVKIQQGQAELNSDGTLASGSFVMDMTTIKATDVDSPGLDQHLQGKDFFDVANHPTATFTMSGFQSAGGNQYEVSGDLAIKGISKPIRFQAQMEEVDSGVRFTARFPVDRTRWDIRYGSPSFFSNLGDRAIVNEFEIELDLLFAKQ